MNPPFPPSLLAFSSQTLLRHARCLSVSLYWDLRAGREGENVRYGERKSSSRRGSQRGSARKTLGTPLYISIYIIIYIGPNFSGPTPISPFLPLSQYFFIFTEHVVAEPAGRDVARPSASLKEKPASEVPV